MPALALASRVELYRTGYYRHVLAPTLSNLIEPSTLVTWTTSTSRLCRRPCFKMGSQAGTLDIPAQSDRLYPEQAASDMATEYDDV